MAIGAVEDMDTTDRMIAALSEIPVYLLRAGATIIGQLGVDLGRLKSDVTHPKFLANLVESLVQFWAEVVEMVEGLFMEVVL